MLFLLFSTFRILAQNMHAARSSVLSGCGVLCEPLPLRTCKAGECIKGAGIQFKPPRDLKSWKIADTSTKLHFNSGDPICLESTSQAKGASLLRDDDNSSRRDQSEIKYAKNSESNGRKDAINDHFVNE